MTTRGPFSKRTVLAAVAASLLMVGGAPASAADKDDFDLDWDDGEIIAIALDDRRTFDTAVLVAPDGSEIAAFLIDRERTDQAGNSGGTSWSMGTGVAVGTGGSSGVGVGVGIGFPIGGGSGNDDPSTIRYRTEAQIRVPDMTAYRAGWEGWVLRIHLPKDELWTERTIELKAPEPPS
jgi:hypothetical protein